MNKEQAVELLCSSVEDWNRWKKTNGGRLSGPNLAGAIFYKANLTSADLSGLRLSGADFSFANLSGADLSEADLSYANLDHAKLVEAKLYAADLHKAIITEADLSHSDCTHAKLRHAAVHNSKLTGAVLKRASLEESRLTNCDLSCAVLAKANLTQTRLDEVGLDDVKLGANLDNTEFRNCGFSRTDFTGSMMVAASFSDCDLSVAANLDLVSHSGPSTIGIDTFHRSKGRIPDEFLRGCGVRDQFIAYKSSFEGGAIEYYSCFISYSHKDRAFARDLHDALQQRGIRCWLDEHQLKPGENIHDAVDAGVNRSDKVLLCASKASLGSWWVDSEIERAFDKERELMKPDGKKRYALIPLNLDGHLFSDEYARGWKRELKSRVAPDFRNWKRNRRKFAAQLERVIEALKIDGDSEEHT